MSSASLIEVAGSAQDVLDRASELRSQGWTVCVRDTRLTASCEVVWTLSVGRVTSGRSAVEDGEVLDPSLPLELLQAASLEAPAAVLLHRA